jgi:hypothetical protein
MNNCCVLLLLALLPAAVFGVSSGFVDTCNAMDPTFGCANFSMGDRLRCMERPARLMGWVLKPVFDATKFEVFAGEEAAKVTTYTPGRWMRISLRTKTFDNQYRGLLLYAVDAADTAADPARVGSFQFTDTRPLFHSWCPGAVLHASADPMPFLTSWRYLPPANFTGTLKFVSLIKVGPANTGEFYYGNQLQLTRVGAAPTPEMKWYVGANNKSCDETCLANGANLICDAAKLATINSATALDRLVAPFVTCKLPYLVRCGDQGVAMDVTGLCYYPNAAQCMTAGLGTTTVMPTCEAKTDDRNVGRRICPCAINSAVSTTTTMTVTTRPVTTTTTTTTTRPVGTTTRPIVTTTRPVTTSTTRTVITTTTRVTPSPTTTSGTDTTVTTRPTTTTTTTARAHHHDHSASANDDDWRAAVHRQVWLPVRRGRLLRIGHRVHAQRQPGLLHARHANLCSGRPRLRVQDWTGVQRRAGVQRDWRVRARRGGQVPRGSARLRVLGRLDLHSGQQQVRARLQRRHGQGRLRTHRRLLRRRCAWLPLRQGHAVRTRATRARLSATRRSA